MCSTPPTELSSQLEASHVHNLPGPVDGEDTRESMKDQSFFFKI